MIYLFLINKTKFLTILSFAVIFSVLTMFFSTKAYAAPNNQGLGWAMAIGKQSASTCFPDDGNSEIVKVILTSSADHSARPRANISLQSVATPSLIVTDSNVNTLQIPCIDPNSGVWVQVWGNSSYLRWDNSFAGQRFNWGMGFASGSPSTDRGKIVTYYVFLVPDAASIEAIAPQPDNTTITIPDTATTANVNFQVRSTRGLPAGGGSYIKEALTWLHKKDGGRLPNCSTDTCFYEVDGSWSFGSTISFSVGNLPIGSYEWYSQLLENNRTYCAYGCLSGTYPITAQFANQNFIIQQEGQPQPIIPPPQPGPNPASLHVRVFNDLDGDGFYDDNEDTILRSDAPGTIVRSGSTGGFLLTLGGNGSKLYFVDYLPESYYEEIYLYPDSNWVPTSYSKEEPGEAVGGYGYRGPDNGYYYTVRADLDAGEATWVYLGMKRKPVQQPDLIPQNLSVLGALQTGAPITFSGNIRNQGTGNAGASHASFTLDSTHLISTPSVSALGPGDGQYVDTVSSPWTATLGTHTVTLCADSNNEVQESDETNNCTKPLIFTINNPPNQWLKTEMGDVGVKGAINMNFLPAGKKNADYLVLAENTINAAFISAKNWLVQGYIPLNVYPSGASDASVDDLGFPRGYKYLLDLYSKNGITTLPTDSSLSAIAGVATTVVQTGDLSTIGIGGTYTGSPKIVFVDGSLKITSNLMFQTDSTQGLIFIVRVNTRIASAVNVVNGVFITYGIFSTSDSIGCAPEPVAHSQLAIYGAVYSFGGTNKTCFTRNIGPSATYLAPAEYIHYQPKYLVLFSGKDFPTGQITTSFQETIP